MPSLFNIRLWAACTTGSVWTCLGVLYLGAGNRLDRGCGRRPRGIGAGGRRRRLAALAAAARGPRRRGPVAAPAAVGAPPPPLRVLLPERREFSYSLMQKNCPLFQFLSFLLPTSLGQPMHSYLALTELPSPNLVHFLLLNPVRQYSTPSRT